MKKLILFTAFFLSVTPSFSQTITKNEFTKTDYLKKSTRQKTTAWIMLGGGVGLSLISFASYSINDLARIFDGNNRSSNTKAALFIAGGVTALGSIPLFIASARNKRKSLSATVGLKIDNSVSQLQPSFNKVSYPALSVKLDLQNIFN